MNSADVVFDAFKRELRKNALDEGISAAVFDKAMSNISLDPDVIRLDSSQPEFTRNIWDYLDSATSATRLRTGKKMLRQHARLLSEVEQRFGVAKEIIVAIWAMESDFGRNYGSKNVLRSLATLAHSSQSKKRSEFARKELLLALRILQTQKVRAGDLVGSWAGAMGQPQFMPTSYLEYAVDYNRDGRKDLWRTHADVFASIANYLSESDWRAGEDWGVEVQLPKKFDWRLNSSSYQLRFDQWLELGVKPKIGGGFQHPKRQAALFIPAGLKGPAFLVAHNFEVIKAYNKSTSYALAVAQLARLLGGGAAILAIWPRHEVALSRYQVEEIQMRLTVDGHNPGVVDGKIGAKTREAIRTWQIEHGLPGDGHASLNFLAIIKNKNKKPNLDQ